MAMFPRALACRRDARNVGLPRQRGLGGFKSRATASSTISSARESPTCIASAHHSADRGRAPRIDEFPARARGPGQRPQSGQSGRGRCRVILNPCHQGYRRRLPGPAGVVNRRQHPAQPSPPCRRGEGSRQAAYEGKTSESMSFGGAVRRGSLALTPVVEGKMVGVPKPRFPRQRQRGAAAVAPVWMSGPGTLGRAQSESDRDAERGDGYLAAWRHGLHAYRARRFCNGWWVQFESDPPPSNAR